MGKQRKNRERKYEETGKRLRLALSLAHMSQTDLGKAIFMSRENISNMCNGLVKIVPETAKKIAEVLNVNWLWLIGESDYMTEEEQEDKMIAKLSDRSTARQELLKQYGITFGTVKDDPVSVMWCKFEGDDKTYYLPMHEFEIVRMDIDNFIFSKVAYLRSMAHAVNEDSGNMRYYIESAKATLKHIEKENRQED